VYYIAGWMLNIYSASEASTNAADNRPACFVFASQTIDERVAKRMNLPTSLVERRKQRASVFCIRGYFDFLCCIESIFLANLTLKMMWVYSNGDIVTRIKTSIISHNEMRERISFLSGGDNEVDNQLLLTYIVERYANMQGTFYGRHLKGNRGNQIQKLADNHATRTKVAHTVVYAKKVEPGDDTFVSDNIHESVKHFGRWLRIMYLNWQVHEFAGADNNNQ
jgi:hypothetical protein